MEGVMADSFKTSAYENLVHEIKQSHDFKLTELEANQIARNLMRFCQRIMDINLRLENEAEKNEDNVALQGVNGNVDAK